MTTHRLDNRDKFVILGSDGVWDPVSSAEAVDLVGRCADAHHASEQIAALARQRWQRGGPIADDITAVVVNLQ